MSQSALHLSEATIAQPDNRGVDRRHSQRHAVLSQVTALVCWGDKLELRRRLCPLSLQNLSRHGIGAMSEHSLEVGSRISVILPPHGPDEGFDLKGSVVRCVERSDGHEIGIELNLKPQPAA